MGLLNIGSTGLNAAQAALVTTSHNISNASVAGYSRQSIVQTTNTPMFTGAGFFGQGTRVETVKRAYNEYLTQQLLGAGTQQAALSTYEAQISQIDNLLADSTVGLSPALQDFFKAVQDVSSSPASVPARQSMISTAQSLVSRFQYLDSRLTEIRQGVEQQIDSSVQEINSYAKQIADMNNRISLARVGGASQQPNDLLDQRDQLISELNQLVRVTTISSDDGSLSVFIGSGQPLVVGVQASTLKATPTPGDPQRLAISLVAPGGVTVQVPETLVDGGKLGGLLAFRSQSLDSAQDQLGQIALDLASTFNAQHALGQDLNGVLGTDFFSFSVTPSTPRSAAGNLRISSAIAGDPSLVAVAAPVVAAATLSNTGRATLTDLTVTSTTGLPLGGAITLAFDDGPPPVLNVSGAVTATLAYDPATQSNGVSFTLANPDLSFKFSGVPADGDSFTISANSGGVSDNRNGVLLGALQLKKTMLGGTASYQSAYSRLVSEVGNKTREVQVNGAAQATLLEQAQSARDSLSAVNLDEEAANLIRFQQAYQAAARVMSVASTLFDEVLAIGR